MHLCITHPLQAATVTQLLQEASALVARAVDTRQELLGPNAAPTLEAQVLQVQVDMTAGRMDEVRHTIQNPRHT
jgi:hypothetical protein